VWHLPSSPCGKSLSWTAFPSGFVLARSIWLAACKCVRVCSCTYVCIHICIYASMHVLLVNIRSFPYGVVVIRLDVRACVRVCMFTSLVSNFKHFIRFAPVKVGFEHFERLFRVPLASLKKSHAQVLNLHLACFGVM